jgi:uncharacterized SAM-binding protein YcdF (DUF218 family)
VQVFWRWGVRVVVGGVVMAAVLVGGTALRVWQVARADDFSRADAIVVLGAAQYSGIPSSVFAARLERARRLYGAGVAPLVVTVGGKRPGDEYTEASAGRKYLMGEGVPGRDVLAVQSGSDTLQSIRAVAAALHARGLDSVARDAGLRAWTAPTRQGPAVFTRESQAHAIVRETGALLWYRLTHSAADFYTVGQ